ncbi:AhpC/TSA family protein [Meridianimaribacter sp. CL38]|uniref:peroxiredoxin-like family protein n=1 Tax=Meridianimaribacter sp. CL38 TaxID=2213021 RepID=UPI00103EEDC6|nr:peroxiredoxin-like family protein [Meridianimaribacter sp. CL38]TBV26917.1 AhpC/TSA family protein [Meridianimaribacter sp. CL38]
MNILKTLSLCLVMSLTFSCKTEQKKDEKSTTETPQATMEEPTPTQTEALEARKSNFSKQADDKTKAIYKDGLDAVLESGILDNAKQVGDAAPTFTLKNAVGTEVALQDYLAKGPVVLVWYRGGWCPYCNINLRYLQEELPNIKAQGANLLAITPELPDQSISTSEKNHLEFEVLSDIGNGVAKEYGVVFKLTDEVAKIYNQKFDLNKHNGDDSNELPLAATYIIDTDGTIRYAFLDSDYRKRAEPSDLTAFLKQMKQ